MNLFRFVTTKYNTIIIIFILTALITCRYLDIKFNKALLLFFFFIVMIYNEQNYDCVMIHVQFINYIEHLKFVSII